MQSARNKDKGEVLLIVQSSHLLYTRQRSRDLAHKRSCLGILNRVRRRGLQVHTNLTCRTHAFSHGTASDAWETICSGVGVMTLLVGVRTWLRYHLGGGGGSGGGNGGRRLGEMSTAGDHVCVCPGSLVQASSTGRGRWWRRWWCCRWRHVSCIQFIWWCCRWRSVSCIQFTWWCCRWRNVSPAPVERAVHKLLNTDDVRDVDIFDTHVDDDIANGHCVVV